METIWQHLCEHPWLYGLGAYIVGVAIFWRRCKQKAVDFNETRGSYDHETDEIEENE